MSDSTQAGGSGRPSRSERVPVSCGECRRRKQKCNQGQPCSNCARRFPAPLCEYITNAHRRSDGPRTYPVITLPFGVLPSAFSGDEHVFIAGVTQALLPPALPQAQQQHQWFSSDWRQSAEGIIQAHWGDDWKGPWTASFDRDFSPSPQPDSNTCQPGCTIHSEAYHSAALLLGKIIAFPSSYVQQWRPEKTDEVLFWLSRQAAIEASSPVSTSGIHILPFQPTRQDAELLRIFVNFVSRFKAALDGDPDMNTSAYMKQYLPFCLHSPLLIQAAIYTSACFLNEVEGRHNLIDSTTAVAHKVRAIRMLHEHLQTHGSTTDEAISGVMQLMLNEWYWGNMDDLKAHSRGLRDMLREKGGFGSKGLGGLLAKLVIVSDIAIALSFESPPYLQGAEFAYRDAMALPSRPFRVSLNTPLVQSLAPFSSCAEPLHLHPATAQILDDIRFLIGLVLALPGNPTEKDLDKVQTTSAWIHEQIRSLPAETPVMQKNRGSGGMLSPVSNVPSNRRASSSGLSTRKSSQHHSPSGLHPQASSEFLQLSTGLKGSAQPQPTSHDVMYQAVRQTALVYARAIMKRKPLRDLAVCSQEDFLRLWTTIWKISLRSWKAVLGVFVWVMLSITPASRGTPHSRFVKSLLTVGMTQMGLEDWDVAEKGMKGALTLVEWLAGHSGSEAGGWNAQDPGD